MSDTIKPEMRDIVDITHALINLQGAISVLAMLQDENAKLNTAPFLTEVNTRIRAIIERLETRTKAGS